MYMISVVPSLRANFPSSLLRIQVDVAADVEQLLAISSRNQRMAPLRARTSAWLSCRASPLCGSLDAGRHLDPVPRDMTFRLSALRRTKPARMVNWPSGGLNFCSAYLESTKAAIVSGESSTIHGNAERSKRRPKVDVGGSESCWALARWQRLCDSVTVAGGARVARGWSLTATSMSRSHAQGATELAHSCSPDSPPRGSTTAAVRVMTFASRIA